MKKSIFDFSIILLIFFLSEQNSSAQQSQDSTKPDFLPHAHSSIASFGLLGHNGTFFYRRYNENSFSQFGIGGSIRFSTTPAVSFAPQSFYISDGVELDYSFFLATPSLHFGKAKRIKINNHLESFFGLNFSLTYQYSEAKEEYTLSDSSKLYPNYYYGPFNSFSYNNDFYKKKTTSENMSTGISPFLGFNYFIGEKWAVGGYYSFGGLIASLPISGEQRIEKKEMGVALKPDISTGKIQPGFGVDFNFNGYGGVFASFSIK